MDQLQQQKLQLLGDIKLLEKQKNLLLSHIESLEKLRANEIKDKSLENEITGLQEGDIRILEKQKDDLLLEITHLGKLKSAQIKDKTAIEEELKILREEKENHQALFKKLDNLTFFEESLVEKQKIFDAQKEILKQKEEGIIERRKNLERVLEDLKKRIYKEQENYSYMIKQRGN